MEMAENLPMVRLLKGSPLTVLFALKVAHRLGKASVDENWLMFNAGYTDKTVKNALKLLAEYGLVQQAGERTWQATRKVDALPWLAGLGGMDGQDEPGREQPGDPVPVGEPEPAPAAQNDPAARKNSESENFRTLSSTRSLNLNTSVLEKDLELARAPLDSEKAQNNLAELDRQGIYSPAREKLAVLAHVTPQLIRYHCQTADTTGHAIYRLEHNWNARESARRAAELAKQAGIPVESPRLEDLPPAEAESAPLDAEPAVAVPAEAESTWALALEMVQREMSRAHFDTWLKPAWLCGYAGETYTAGLGNQYAVDWLEKNAIAARMASALEMITGQPAEVVFVVRPWEG